jgi:hypothetical protein
MEKQQAPSGIASEFGISRLRPQAVMKNKRFQESRTFVRERDARSHGKYIILLGHFSIQIEFMFIHTSKLYLLETNKQHPSK